MSTRWFHTIHTIMFVKVLEKIRGAAGEGIETKKNKQ